MKILRRFLIVVATVSALFLAIVVDAPATVAATKPTTNPQKAEKLRVVASFSVVADWVQQLGGDAVEVVSILPPNADNHSYQAAPQDMKKLRDADIVVAMSPKFEKWLDEIARDTLAKNPEKFVFLADDLLATDLGGDNTIDPHFWMNPQLVAEKFLPEIERAIKIENAEYVAAVAALKREGESAFATIPPERRKIVIYHNNMENFAKCFGFEIAGTILDSATTEAADPSAKKFAALAATIRRGKLPIFVDNTVDDRVPAALAKEAGVAAPRKIRVDALDAPNTPAGTYIGMMRENFRTIAEACSTTN